MGRRLADLFHGRPRLQVGGLLAGPLGWLVIVYLGSLVVMLVAAFWSVDALSGEITHTFSTDNFQTLVDDPSTGRRPADGPDRRARRPSPTHCSRFRSPSTWRRSPARG